MGASWGFLGAFWWFLWFLGANIFDFSLTVVHYRVLVGFLESHRGSPPGVPTAASWQQPSAIIFVFALKTNTFLTFLHFLGLSIPKNLLKPMKNQHFCFWDLPGRPKKLIKPMKSQHVCVLGRLGLSKVLLGHPCGVLGVSCGRLGPSWGVLRAS